MTRHRSEEDNQKIIKDYKNPNMRISEVIKKHDLYSNSHLYQILNKYNVPRRNKLKKGGNINIKDLNEFKIFKVETNKDIKLNKEEIKDKTDYVKKAKELLNETKNNSLLND